MKKWIPNFLSEFHKAVLKPLGYKKSGSAFYKDKGEYWERIYFQGSPIMTYCFYVNIGVEFKDVHDYDCRHNFILIPSTHWAVRIAELIPEAPKEWIIQENTDRDKLTELLSILIPKASEAISTSLTSIRNELENRLQMMSERKKTLHKNEKS